MKVQIAENLEEPFRERFSKLEEELEHYRSEYNKLRYEHSFLKSEYEHETAEHKRIIEELKLQYETEVSPPLPPPPPYFFSFLLTLSSNRVFCVHNYHTGRPWP